MVDIGLTGGIASGKSTVAHRFAELGGVVVDADRIAREVVEPGTPGLAQVVEAFGEQVLLPDGTLDRPALGRIVFSDASRLQQLNGITHPLIGVRRQELIDAAPPGSVLVHDIPLLVEGGLMAAFDLVVVVWAPPEERVRRMIVDRGMSPDDAEARIRAQATDEERRAAADVWIDNSGSREATIARADACWKDRIEPLRADRGTTTE